MSWTFAGIAFSMAAPDRNGVPVLPAFRSPPNIVKHSLAGTRDTIIAHLGFKPTELSATIHFSDPALLTWDGRFGTLSDGTTSWNALIEIDARQIVTGTDGYTGQATFTLGRAVT